jgi:CxxC-x17-CxxC domain-containing protein
MSTRSQASSSPEAGQKPGSVMVQKRAGLPKTEDREKLCATCGKPFTLSPEQKYFLCPRCYQKSLPPRKTSRPGETQLLIQIQCPDCGTEEYVGFVPQDPQATFCKACFAKRKRKPVQP